jgi:hypothetical protein
MRILCAGLATLVLAPSASAGLIYSFSDASGLSGEAEFSLQNAGTELVVRARNTSTGVPGTFDNSDQILTGVSWDLATVLITGGTVLTGPNSQSINFDVMNVGPNADVSGEWGYGNGPNGTGALPSFISANEADATPFGGANLDDGPALNGPQGGLVSAAFALPLGGLGAIEDEIIATLSLSSALSEQELADLLDDGVRFEFGSDAAFFTVPAPGTLGLLVLAGMTSRRRRG